MAKIKKTPQNQISYEYTNYLKTLLLGGAAAGAVYCLCTRPGYIESYNKYQAKIIEYTNILNDYEVVSAHKTAEYLEEYNANPGFAELLEFPKKENFQYMLEHAQKGLSGVSHNFYQLPLKIITIATVGFTIPSDQEIFQVIHDIYDYAINIVGLGDNTSDEFLLD